MVYYGRRTCLATQAQLPVTNCKTTVYERSQEGFKELKENCSMLHRSVAQHCPRIVLQHKGCVHNSIDSTSRVRSFGTVTILRVWFRVRIPLRARGFSLLPNDHTGSGVRPDSCSMGTGVLFRDQSCHSPSSSAQVKSEWRYNSTPSIPVFLNLCETAAK